MLEDDPAVHLEVILTRGSATQMWSIDWSPLSNRFVYRRLGPRGLTSGSLDSQPAAMAKHDEFLAEIAAARAEGWS